MAAHAKLLALIEGHGIDHLTLEQLGQMCGVSRERVRQLLKRLGLTKTRLVGHPPTLPRPLCACGCGQRCRSRQSRFLGEHYHGKANPAWRGGRRLNTNGYVLILAHGHHLADCDGYVFEHRLIAERKLGRRLNPKEVIHHIDGDRTNNKPDNLMVCASAGAHKALFHH